MQQAQYVCKNHSCLCCVVICILLFHFNTPQFYLLKLQVTWGLREGRKYCSVGGIERIASWGGGFCGTLQIQAKTTQNRPIHSVQLVPSISSTWCRHLNTRIISFLFISISLNDNSAEVLQVSASGHLPSGSCQACHPLAILLCPVL